MFSIALAVLLRLIPAPGLGASMILAAAQVELHSPTIAAHVVTVGQHPEVREALLRVCWRESRCRSIGEHGRDSHLSRSAWRGQVQLGHLEEDCQPYGGGGWATRGAFGLSAAAHWQYMPACYQPEAFDSSWVSAWVAMRKWLRVCTERCPQRWSARANKGEGAWVAIGWCPGARSASCAARRN
jgi:hypothetical protein